MTENSLLQDNASRREILQHWQPEDNTFWEKHGKHIAKQNLYVSTWALTLSFCVWTLWATIAAQLNGIGFHFSDQQIFTLAALPGLVGATGRLFYTYMPGILGGKNWTFISTALMLLPVIGLGNALQDITTSYDTLCLLVSFIGIAGANFSSSMANIGNFFPKSQKGTALGINAGVGNLGVSIIYLVAPFAIGTAIFGNLFGGPQITAAGKTIYLQNACYLWVVPIIITLALIWLYMDNLPLPKQSPKSMLSIFNQKHTWVMTWIYTCGFGSFIGYSAALAVLVNKEFPEISFTYAAFLGPFIGAGIRPFGGWLADKINNGAKITFWSLIVLFLASILVLLGIQTHNFILFFSTFMLLFLMTGFVNGASFRMIPYIFKNPFHSSLVTGFTAAIGAYGAFFVPKIFGWSYASFGNVSPAFYILFLYTFLTILLTWYFYARKNSGMKC